MKMNLKGHARLEINGRVIPLTVDVGELRSIIASMVQELIHFDIESSNFSTLQFTFSKRPIPSKLESSNWDSLLMEKGIEVNQVHNDDPIEGFPDITWGEFSQLTDDPIWVAARNLAANRSGFGEREAQEIIGQYMQKYGDTKFAKLLGDKPWA